MLCVRACGHNLCKQAQDQANVYILRTHAQQQVFDEYESAKRWRFIKDALLP